MKRWKESLLSAAFVAALPIGCSLPPHAPPGQAVFDADKNLAESSSQAALTTPPTPAPVSSPALPADSPKPGTAASEHEHGNQPHRPGMQDSAPAPELQPGVGERFTEPPPIPPTPSAEAAIETGETGPTEGSVTLEALEALACGNNPTLVQAKAQVDGAFGKAIQAGLWPNPVFFYVGEQIGVDSDREIDTPGEWQGAQIQQEFVTADKLDLSRSKFLERVKTAEWLAMAQEYRVLNDVRLHFFRTLGRQNLVQIHQELLKNAEDSLVTVREGYNLGYHPRSRVHQVNALLQEQRLKFLMAQNEFRTSFESLTALAGVELPTSALEGVLEGDTTPVEWEDALCRLLTESPEIQAAHAKLRSDVITLRREEVEPIPNIVVQGGAGYNFEAVETTAAAQVSLEVPLWDWNQGTVKQAEADLVRQRSEVRRTELRLRRELAQVYGRYLTALQHVENFRDVVLPESRKAYESLLDSYEDDRVRWLDVLAAEREYFLRREEYVRNLIAWREAEVLIAGYLLHGGLMPPMEITPPSHIDAVPKPR